MLGNLKERERERALHNSVQVDIYKHEAGRAQQMRSNIHHPRKFRDPDPRRAYLIAFCHPTLCAPFILSTAHTHTSAKSLLWLPRLDLSTTYTTYIYREREMNGNDITRYRPSFY